MTLSSEDRETLERLARDRLLATANDDKNGRWSFLFGTEGAVDFLYCPWFQVEDEDLEFYGEIEDVRALWRPDRLDLIRRGDADPNEEELLQWRRATCRRLVEKGSDICSVAWVVPLWLDSGVAGYALFLCDLGGAESDVPELVGVFENLGEAKSRLLLEGAVAGF